MVTAAVRDSVALHFKPKGRPSGRPLRAGNQQNADRGIVGHGRPTLEPGSGAAGAGEPLQILQNERKARKAVRGKKQAKTRLKAAPRKAERSARQEEPAKSEETALVAVAVEATANPTITPTENHSKPAASRSSSPMETLPAQTQPTSNESPVRRGAARIPDALCND
jgi:hypothetical protein